MSETPSDSGSKPKAISSLAKRPSEVTRQGTQKLKFVPTLPARRSKDAVKTEPAAESIPSPSNDRGRSRGRGDGRGRGRGGPRPSVEMVASGPFAMGPATASSSSSRRAVQAANPIPIPKAGTSSRGAGLSQTKIKTEESREKSETKEEEEVYSDPDEGVEIIDIENVRQMDWMAPDSLKKENPKKLKKEDSDAKKVEPAIHETEDERDLDVMVDDFGGLLNNEDPSSDSQRLYFFQFPSPFPTFSSNSKDAMQTHTPVTPGPKKVTFAPEVKDETEVKASSSRGTPETKEELDGLIGHLEVYRSGARKMRLANGIVLDVHPATQSSFLEHAVHLDLNENRLAVLGEVYKRYVVSPDVDILLSAIDAQDKGSTTVIEGEENLIRMDIT